MIVILILSLPAVWVHPDPHPEAAMEAVNKNVVIIVFAAGGFGKGFDVYEWAEGSMRMIWR